MGSTAEETTHFNASAGLAAQEKPQHSVTIMRPFALGKYLVTRGEFAAFVAATGYSDNQAWRSPGFAQTDRDPVVRVSYQDAQRYVAWLNQLSGGSAYRLPSEAEWEYAARAGTTTTFYWGDTVGKNNANCADCGSRWGGKGTSPVGSFAANRFGLYDMAGNLWQWVEDCNSDSYAGAPTDGSPWLSQHCDQRGVRGGAWNSSPLDLRSANRGGDDPGTGILISASNSPGRSLRQEFLRNQTYSLSLELAFVPPVLVLAIRWSQVPGVDIPATSADGASSGH